VRSILLIEQSLNVLVISNLMDFEGIFILNVNFKYENLNLNLKNVKCLLCLKLLYLEGLSTGSDSHN
jgi:hypothetical protein